MKLSKGLLAKFGVGLKTDSSESFRAEMNCGGIVHDIWTELPEHPQSAEDKTKSDDQYEIGLGQILRTEPL